MESGYIPNVLKVEPTGYFSGLEVAWENKKSKDFSKKFFLRAHLVKLERVK